METPRRRGRWLWFACGFAVVFVVMLAFYPMNAMHRSGQYLVRERLWEYYADTLPRFFGTSTLGPASSNTDMFLGVATQHLGFSAVGGCVAAGIGWWRRRRVSRAT